jgi:hypothetical protein
MFLTLREYGREAFVPSKVTSPRIISTVVVIGVLRQLGKCDAFTAQKRRVDFWNIHLRLGG